jgi:protein-arginine kinase
MLMTGCASIPAPTEQIAVSKEAVESANSAGGNEFAPLQLKSVMDKMDAAERAMNIENYALAKQLAEQAQVDAQLASATGTVSQGAKGRQRFIRRQSRATYAKNLTVKPNNHNGIHHANHSIFPFDPDRCRHRFRL